MVGSREMPTAAERERANAVYRAAVRKLREKELVRIFTEFQAAVGRYSLDEADEEVFLAIQLALIAMSKAVAKKKDHGRIPSWIREAHRQLRNMNTSSDCHVHIVRCVEVAAKAPKALAHEAHAVLLAELYRLMLLASDTPRPATACDACKRLLIQYFHPDPAVFGMFNCAFCRAAADAIDAWKASEKGGRGNQRWPPMLALLQQFGFRTTESSLDKAWKEKKKKRHAERVVVPAEFLELLKDRRR